MSDSPRAMRFVPASIAWRVMLPSRHRRRSRWRPAARAGWSTQSGGAIGVGFSATSRRRRPRARARRRLACIGGTRGTCSRNGGAGGVRVTCGRPCPPPPSHPPSPPTPPSRPPFPPSPPPVPFYLATVECPEQQLITSRVECELAATVLLSASEPSLVQRGVREEARVRLPVGCVHATREGLLLLNVATSKRARISTWANKAVPLCHRAAADCGPSGCRMPLPQMHRG